MLSADASSATAPPVSSPLVQAPDELKFPPATNSWQCQNCGGFWFEANQEGADWMLEKVQYLYGVPHERAFLSHECEACTGLYMEGKGPPRGPGSTIPSGTAPSATSSSSPPSSSSSGLAHYLSHNSWPERLSSRPPSYTLPQSPTSPPLPK